MNFLFDANGVEVQIGDWLYYTDGAFDSVAILEDVDNSSKGYLCLKDLYTGRRTNRLLEQVKKVPLSEAVLIALEF